MQYYIPQARKDNYFMLSKQDHHHLLKVLRMKNNDVVSVIFEGYVYLCSVNIDDNDLKLLIKDKKIIESELKTNITLIYGLPRTEKFELVIQKAVELGVSRVIPFNAERSIVKYDTSKIESKLKRWDMIIKEASEQSHRTELLKIFNPIDAKELKKYLSEVNIIADENKHDESTNNLFKILDKSAKSITILIGPEGGFSRQEVEMFKQLGFEAVSLGKRILRTETAAIYLMSVISFMSERNL